MESINPEDAKNDKKGLTSKSPLIKIESQNKASIK